MFNAVVTLRDDEIQNLLRSLSCRGTREAVVGMINKAGKYGETPLMAAVLLKSTRTVCTLIDAGADVHAYDSQGMTCLMFAAIRGKTRTVRILRDAGARLETRDKAGNTALMYAVKSPCSAAVKVLMERDADLWGDGYGRSEVLEAYGDTTKESLAKMMIQLGLYQDMFIVKNSLLREQYNIMKDMMNESTTRNDSCNLVLLCKNILQFSCGCGTRCEAERARIKRGLNLLSEVGAFDVLDREALGDIFITAAVAADLDTLIQIHTAIQGTSESPNIIDYAHNIGETALLLIMKRLHGLHGSGERAPEGLIKGIIDCTCYLIECHADVTLRDENGYNPFEYAVYSTDIEVVKAMLERMNSCIRSMHWKRFKALQPGMQPCREQLVKCINISDIDISSNNVPWATGCCERCNSRKIRDMQRFLLNQEGGLLPQADKVLRQEECTTDDQDEYVVVYGDSSSDDFESDIGDFLLDESSDDFDSSDDDESQDARQGIALWWNYLVR